jgi:hypothetical protein
MTTAIVAPISMAMQARVSLNQTWFFGIPGATPRRTDLTRGLGNVRLCLGFSGWPPSRSR